MANTRGTTSVTIALLVALLAATAARAEDEEARTLVKRALDALPKVPLAATVELSRDGAQARLLDLRSKTLAGARASYLEVKAPEEFKGMKFLFIERPDAPPQQYMKVSFSKRPVEILGAIRQRPFLGSTFYIADLVEQRLDDYTYSFAGSESVLGRTCRLVESVPKDTHDPLYSKTVIAIDPTDAVVLKRVFFGKDGKPVKRWVVEQLEKIKDFPTLMVQQMTDLPTNEEWVLRIREIDYGVDLPDSMFKESYLARH